MLDWLISTSINSKAIDIYRKMGGKSPILDESNMQADALQKLLSTNIHDIKFQTFVVMRYWRPQSADVMMKLKEFNPSEVILLPLYPQFSSTTTGSSFKDLETKIISNFPQIAIKKLCCYYADNDYIASIANLIKEKINTLQNFIILFSAHSLPISVIKKGDPYEWQIEECVKKIMNLLPENTNHRICYQSKVGRMKWLEPSTEKLIEQYAQANKNLVIVPIAFVNEHSETLVELDIDYAKIAEENSVEYVRISTLRANSEFVDSLYKMINLILKNDHDIQSSCLKRLCPNKFSLCQNKNKEYYGD